MGCPYLYLIYRGRGISILLPPRYTVFDTPYGKLRTLYYACVVIGKEKVDLKKLFRSIFTIYNRKMLLKML